MRKTHPSLLLAETEQKAKSMPTGHSSPSHVLQMVGHMLLCSEPLQYALLYMFVSMVASCVCCVSNIAALWGFGKLPRKAKRETGEERLK